jgi:hypothetical protein
MGVMGTTCQLCGLPLAHDHYVPDARGYGLKIYRQAEPGGGHTWEPGERVITFGPEHAWLADAVAVPRYGEPRVLAGPVQDGAMVDVNTEEVSHVFSGDDDAFALHKYCHTLMGSPLTPTHVLLGRGCYGWAQMESYQAQLFAFAELMDDGLGVDAARPARHQRQRCQKPRTHR